MTVLPCFISSSLHLSASASLKLRLHDPGAATSASLCVQNPATSPLARTRCRSCREEETRYLVRTLIANLRVGAGTRTVTGAMGRAALLVKEGPAAPADRVAKAVAAAQSAWEQCPSIELLVEALLDDGCVLDVADRVGVRVGVPVKPMLAKPCTGPGDAIGGLGTPVVLEWKYDGQRCQVGVIPGSHACFSLRRLWGVPGASGVAPFHVSSRCRSACCETQCRGSSWGAFADASALRCMLHDHRAHLSRTSPHRVSPPRYECLRHVQVHVDGEGQVRLFSRNCEDLTGAFPELVDVVRRRIKSGAPCILDGEIVAIGE